MQSVIIKKLGLQPYDAIYQRMLTFSDQRDAQTPDEIWLLQHEPVYTLGKNAKKHHVLNTGSIPLVQVDRGGQVTYHGPGQLIAYLLFDVKRAKYGVRQIVTAMEQAIIAVLAEYDINANARADAPGVYVNDAKIAALGLRIRKGRSYHGLSFNLDMDLTPFNGINPCGYKNLAVTQLSNYTSHWSESEIETKLLNHISHALNVSE